MRGVNGLQATAASSSMALLQIHSSGEEGAQSSYHLLLRRARDGQPVRSTAASLRHKHRRNASVDTPFDLATIPYSTFA